MASALALGRRILFLILKTILDFARIWPLLELTLLVMWKKIVEKLQIVCEVVYTDTVYTIYILDILGAMSSSKSAGARECAAHHDMALGLFSANWQDYI
jgi:hypothetical protein